MVYSKFVEKQVLDSPFTNKEFLNLVKQFNDDQDTIFEDFAISDKTIVNIGNRDFVDYRPTSEINKNILQNNSISNVNFDSFFSRIQKILQSDVYKSIRVKNQTFL